MSTIPVEAIEAAVDTTLRKMAKKKRKVGPERADRIAHAKWKKGQSGNPTGLPKAKKITIPEAFEQVLAEPAEVLKIAKAVRAVAQSENHPGMIRATELLLDRTVGKAAQKMEHSGSIGLYRVELIGLSPDEMARAADLFRPPVGGQLAESVEGADQPDAQPEDEDE